MINPPLSNVVCTWNRLETLKRLTWYVLSVYRSFTTQRSNVGARARRAYTCHMISLICKNPNTF